VPTGPSRSAAQRPGDIGLRLNHVLGEVLWGVRMPQITSGDLVPGQRLPSIVDLATEYHVTTGTVQKALRILKSEGLIISVPSYGTFVAERN
jgi:hypothetical protein